MIIPESWKLIEEYPRYKVSNIGRVKSQKGLNFCMLKPIKHPNGYLYVSLYNDLGISVKRIHRLVLETFGDKCPDGYQCNHKDGHKWNNFLENLEWVTPNENIQHAIKLGLYKPFTSLRGEENLNAKLNDDKVWLIKGFLWYRLPMTEIAKIFGINISTVSRINAKQIWSHIEFIPEKEMLCIT